MNLAPLQKLPNNVGDLGKIIATTGFEWLPKEQKNRPIWSHWILKYKNACHKGLEKGKDLGS